MPGRPPKPTAALAPDAFARNPNRRREEIDGGPPLTAPDRCGWGPAKVAIWEELVARSPANVLRECDGFIVEAAVELIARMRDPDSPAPLSAYPILKSLLVELGMTPAARARIAAPAKSSENKNPFASLDDDIETAGDDTRPN